MGFFVFTKTYALPSSRKISHPVIVRGKEENWEKIDSLLKQFIPQFSKEELNKRWYLTAATFMIATLAGGLLIGFVAKRLNLI